MELGRNGHSATDSVASRVRSGQYLPLLYSASLFSVSGNGVGLATLATVSIFPPLFYGPNKCLVLDEPAAAGEHLMCPQRIEGRTKSGVDWRRASSWSRTAGALRQLRRLRQFELWRR